MTEKANSGTIELVDEDGIRIILNKSQDGNLEISKSDKPGQTVVFSPNLIERLLGI